jgi:energy-coupling factor transporter ATP-binding protein EcfA2
MIAIEGLSFRFRGGRDYALRDVNLAVAAGEFVVVTGPSGCGKSTLALAIGGYLFRQYDGEAEGIVTVAGMDVRRCPIYDVAEVVGLVQQNPEAQFCALTVQEEVAFGLENRCLPRDEIRQRVAWALSIVGAAHLADRSLATLSGGEKQKIAIAAMMAAKPQALVFDEPTSNLDPTATAEIFGVIARIRAKANITVIVIEHKVDYLLPFGPRLVAMDDGHIVYDGQMQAASGKWQVASGEPTHATRPTQRATRNTPVVCVQDLHVGYDGAFVLQDVSLTVHPGELVAVMGDNGSGKTTLLQSLLGLLKPGRGRVEVLGQDTRRTPVSQLARQVGFVFQNPDHQLFADSVWREATFAPRNFGALDEATRARVESLLARCGLSHRRDDPPYRLSYGEKRRLNLISVLAYAPRLVLLDEVLIGQDAANAAFVLELLRERVEQGGAAIMVNHHPPITRRYAGRLIFFDRGRVVVDAPTEEGFRLLAAQGRQAYLPPSLARGESMQRH